jgi:hypothetical protein
MEDGPKCKVYTLLPDGSWQDSGTGYASASKFKLIVVLADSGAVWEQLLSTGDTLRRQQGGSPHAQKLTKQYLRFIAFCRYRAQTRWYLGAILTKAKRFHLVFKKPVAVVASGA